MRRAIGLLITVGLWLVLALPALAQSGSVRIEDADGVLAGDTSVQAAAQRLANAGAQVIVVVAGSSAGTSEPSASQYLNRVLSEKNLAPSSDQLQPNQIVFYVARDARQTSLRFGQQYIAKLSAVESGIQAEQMNPRFAAGDVPGGLVAGINAVDTTLNPPPSRVPYYLGGLVLVGAIVAFAVPALRRRRVATETLAGAKTAAAQARRAAGGAIADLGQLAKTAEDKAQYDRLSYSAADLERVQTLQEAGMEQFRQAQAAFDVAEEQLAGQAAPGEADYVAVVTRYGEAQRLAQQATVQINEVERLRLELDKRGAPATGGTTRLEP